MPNPQKAARVKKGSKAVVTIPRTKSVKLMKRRMVIERFLLLRISRAVMPSYCPPPKEPAACPPCPFHIR
jgi:hypothetical protein